MSEKGFFTRNIIVGTISGVIAGVVLLWLGWLFNSPILQTLQSAWTWLWAPVETWRWFYFLLLGWMILSVAGFILSRIPAPEGVQPPEFLAYKQRKLFGMVWRWRWTRGGNIDRDYVCSFCPNDDMQLVPGQKYNGQPIMQCEKCGQQFELPHNDPHAAADAVVRHIHCDLRTGEWKRHVENNDAKV